MMDNFQEYIPWNDYYLVSAVTKNDIVCRIKVQFYFCGSPRRIWLDIYIKDPFLISEGLFGAGMISSNLKLVHIFAINPHLGPLQVCIYLTSFLPVDGKMLSDAYLCLDAYWYFMMYTTKMLSDTKTYISTFILKK